MIDGLQRLTNRAIAGAIALGGLPLGLALVLAFTRPDLMAPMLAHVFGSVLVATVLVLVAGGVVAHLVGALQRSPAARVGLSSAGFVLCTLPALFLVLFGPIVFAFMFGDVGGR